MRILRFIKNLWLYLTHSVEFKKKFPNATFKTYLNMIPTAWRLSKKELVKIELPTQAELISWRVDVTLGLD